MALALAGCRDTSGPPSNASRDVDVTLRVVTVEGPTVSLRDGLTDVTCTVLYEAAASAVGGPGFWEGGELLFFAGRDRSEALDTLPLSLTEVADFWGGAQIMAGDTLRTQLRVAAGVPFATKLTMRYRPRREAIIETLEASFACGATVPAGAPPPTLTPLAVEPASGTVDYGQVMTIGFTAQSQIGFVQTELVLSGACDLARSENHFLEKTVVRTIEIVLPANCRNGEPLVITVTALDGALELASRQFTMTLTFVDVTPPTLTPLFFSPNGGGAVFQLSGNYFVGDSIHLIPNAHDNHLLSALLWEVLPAGIRDSAVGFVAGSNLKIPIRESWGTGPIQLRLVARDVAGLLSDVYLSAPGAVQVHPVIARPVRTTQVSGEVRDLLIDSRRGVLYLLQPFERKISVLALSTLTVTRSIPLPAVPADLDMTPRGDSLVVTLPQSRALAIIDLRDEAAAVQVVPLTILDESTQQMPELIRIVSSGKAFVSLAGSATRAQQLAEIDLATNSQRLRLDAGEAGHIGSGNLERSRDASMLVVQGGPGLFQRYDVSTDAFGPRRNAIPFMRPAIDMTGQRVSLGTDVYDGTLQFLRTVTVPFPGGVPPTALSPDGEYLYSSFRDPGIIRSRVSDGAIVDRAPNTIEPSLIRISPDGTFLVTTDQNRGGIARISIMDLR
jgi:hypothetical protein